MTNSIKKSISIRVLWLAFGSVLTVALFAVMSARPRLAAPVPVSVIPTAIAADKHITPATNDVSELISLHRSADALSRRQQLAKFIWGPRGLPALLPDKIDRVITDARYSSLKNLKQINRLTVSMEWGLTSTAYHFIPESSNGELLIYHQGHDGDFIGGISIIRLFVEKGFAVIALSMPLDLPNNRPTVDLKGIGRLQLTFHNQFKFLTMKSGHPVQLFFTPVAASLNYAQQFDYTSVSMTGISGGGWTTTVYAALDPRINRSYPVAGSLPLHLRHEVPVYTSQLSNDWGDYEQTIPELMRIANYLEMYVLGSHGVGRKQIQILNKFDACCFAGERSNTYEAAVKDRVKNMGAGEYSVFLDTSHREHKISSAALKVMLDDIASASTVSGLVTRRVASCCNARKPSE